MFSLKKRETIQIFAKRAVVYRWEQVGCSTGKYEDRNSRVSFDEEETHTIHGT